MSRANIGKLIGLSRFTTSEVTGEMVDNRILRELGPDNREGRGKRSQVLAIDTDFWRIVSVDLSNPMLVKGALADLSGRIVDRTELPVDHGCSVDDVISLVQAAHQLNATADPWHRHRGDRHCGTQRSGAQIRALGVERTAAENRSGKRHRSARDRRQRHQCGTCGGTILRRLLPQFHAHFHRAGRRRGIMPQRRHHRRKFLHCRRNRTRGGRPERANLRMRQTGMSRIIRFRRQAAATHLAGSRRAYAYSYRSGRVARARHGHTAGLLDLRDISVYGAPEIVNTQFIDAMENEISRTVTTDYQEAPQIHRCRQGEDLTLRGQATIVIRTLVPTIHERGSLIGEA